MKSLAVACFIVLACFGLNAQCLTDFTKLLPEPSIDHTQDFGRSISMYEDYLAIGIPNYDSLGRITGIVRIYQKIGNGWRKIATVVPSDLRDALQFGVAVKLSRDYLLVSAGGYRGKVYLFKKPATGWVSQTELTSFSVANSANFGSGLNHPIDISPDQNTIVIADQWYTASPLPQNYHGAIFVYHRPSGFEWNSSIAPTVIHAPETDAADFGRGGVVIFEDRLFTSTPFAPTGNGRIYVYRDVSGDFVNLTLEAKLSSGSSAESSFLGFKNFVVTEDGIFASAVVDMYSTAQSHVIFFKRPASGTWQDADRTCSINPVGFGSKTSAFLTLSTNGEAIYVSGADADGKGFFNMLNKTATGWCNAEPVIIDSFVPTERQLMRNYGAVNTSSQNSSVAVGFVAHPDNESAQLSLKILWKDSDGDWVSQLLYPSGKSTAGHGYGNTMLGFDDYLFVCAPYDGTIRANGGAVYTYKKVGTSWTKTGNIFPPVKGQYDDVFGTALAANGNQLAVGASGFEDHGRVFIYEKKSSDWSTIELKQEIELPTDILTVYAYGDNLAMNKDWLLIPYVQNAPARSMLAIYKFENAEWIFKQALEIGLANLFAKETTLSVDIEDETIVAGNAIIEKNSDGNWEIRHVLTTSDPEPIRISSDFTHWVSNGSMFGHKVDISNNSIFISAPTKDFGDVWDVGAVYVYTKRPGESWSSRTETAKILPRVKDEGELFGYALKVLDNTLIAGAPGADFYKNGVTARNKPGRAYVFQAKDYFWQDVIPLIDVTGDSFIKDYFGIAVNMDHTDFFIGASIEDIDDAKLSGSVYITPAPPIVQLVPPVCSTQETINLLGYPFGGTWSGPGITDENEGIFDPKIAGLGEHEYTYKTVSCAYEGKLRIAIEAPAETKLAVDDTYYVCKDSQINIPLEVQGQNGYNYQWYYREKSDADFIPLEQQNNRLSATNVGDYKAKGSNNICESFSSIISIKYETQELTLNPVSKICQDLAGGIILTATPVGGTWTGAGVSNNILYTSPVKDGDYSLTYTYTSARGCVYSHATPLSVHRLTTPNIQRTGGNLCVEGKVTLRLLGQIANTTYDWQWKGADLTDFTSLDAHETEIIASDRGSYRIVSHFESCSATSNEVAINENTFELKMFPAEADLKVCQGNSIELFLQNVPGRTYKWFFAEDNHEQPQVIAGSSNTYTVETSGLYYVIAESGLCTAQTPSKRVTILPEDRIFIPNIFTPNGDGYNDEFKIESNQNDLQYRIMNRYGQQIFSGNSSSPWTGEGSVSGVYFWVASYRTCLGVFKKAKGFVHLSR